MLRNTLDSLSMGELLHLNLGLRVDGARTKVVCVV